MDEGLKSTFTPLGSPLADKATAESKPPETVVVIFTCPCAPGAIVTFPGAAAIVKVPPPLVVTVNVTVVVSVVAPAVPVTVIGYDPAATVEPTVIVMLEVPFPVIDVGLKLTVTPRAGRMPINTTAVLNPPVTVLVMVEVPVPPCRTETAVGGCRKAEAARRAVPPARAVNKAGPIGAADASGQIVADSGTEAVASAGDVMEVSGIARTGSKMSYSAGLMKPERATTVWQRLLVDKGHEAGPHWRRKAGAAIQLLAVQAV